MLMRGSIVTMQTEHKYMRIWKLKSSWAVWDWTARKLSGVLWLWGFVWQLRLAKGSKEIVLTVFFEQQPVLVFGKCYISVCHCWSQKTDSKIGVQKPFLPPFFPSVADNDLWLSQALFFFLNLRRWALSIFGCHFSSKVVHWYLTF